MSAACPSNIVLNNDVGVCGAVATYSAATGADNCGATVTRTSGLTSGSSAAVGTETVNYQASDAAGLQATCEFSITVNDVEAPVLTCPADIAQNTLPGVCYATPTYQGTFAENCYSVSGATVTRPAGYDSGAQVAPGATETTFVVTDAAGNAGTCSFTTTVSDAEAPQITCPGDITTNTDAGVCTAAVTISTATVEDNCGVDSQSPGSSGSSTFARGTSSVEHSVTDATGNENGCYQQVTVEDAEAPTVTSCPSNMTESAPSDQCGATVTYSMATFSDNCDSVSGVLGDPSMGSGNTFSVGTHGIVITGTDTAGLSGVCTFGVTVTDVTAPNISCPGDIEVDRDSGLCTAVVSFVEPVGTDACGVTTVQTAGLGPGAAFGLGSTSVEYTATDASGNVASCSFVVRVRDANHPTITCPSDVSVGNAAGQCAAVVTYPSPNTSSCELSTVGSPTAIGSGGSFSVGTHTETYIVSNVLGVNSSCSFTVTVADQEAPAITCDAGGAIGNAAGQCYATLTYTAPVGTDNCAGASTSQTAGVGPGGQVSVGSSSTETYVVTDGAGLTADCSLSFSVTDQEVPTITCPANIVVSTESGRCDAVVNYSTPVYSDNCAGASVSLTAGLGSGARFSLGMTTVTYVVTDAAGLTADCSFTVAVEDDEDPVLSCPSDSSVGTDFNVCYHAVSYTVSHTDNCAGSSQSKVSGAASGAQLELGANTVVYSATDGSGNAAQCSFTYTVSDTQAPRITCPVVGAQSNDAGQCGAVVGFAAASGWDNCAGVSVAATSAKSGGDTFDVGSTEVSFEATDGAGQTADCSFNVVVNDNELPLISE